MAAPLSLPTAPSLRRTSSTSPVEPSIIQRRGILRSKRAHQRLCCPRTWWRLVFPRRIQWAEEHEQPRYFFRDHPPSEGLHTEDGLARWVVIAKAFRAKCAAWEKTFPCPRVLASAKPGTAGRLEALRYTMAMNDAFHEVLDEIKIEGDMKRASCQL